MSDATTPEFLVRAEPQVQPVTQSVDDLTIRQLRKREWLLEFVERQRALAPAISVIERRAGLTTQEFLERYYAANRPVILTGEMADWPALARWNPDYLAERVGAQRVEFQGQRNSNARFELDKDAHRNEAPFDAFIDMIKRPGAGNDAYITAYNSACNAKALSVLHADLGFLDKFLSREAAHPNGMMWIGPAGTVTSLHHDLTNNFIAQLVGRKRLKLLPAAEVGRLYNHKHVFSEIADLEDPQLDRARFARLNGARLYDITLNPGEIIFVPLAWWHQVKSLDFSVTLTYTNFLWPNDAHASYPAD
jgi:ribosomal protein L16 Arg81 hydroxylase